MITAYVLRNSDNTVIRQINNNTGFYKGVVDSLKQFASELGLVGYSIDIYSDGNINGVSDCGYYC